MHLSTLEKPPDRCSPYQHWLVLILGTTASVIVTTAVTATVTTSVIDDCLIHSLQLISLSALIKTLIFPTPRSHRPKSHP